MFDREALVKQVEATKNWDVIIIGGGATGLGVALDSASRGYKTLLLEQSDFAKGTSSRSTKLIHGGVRYLAQGDIDLVKTALYERGLLLKNASHLVRNQSFIIPTYKFWNKLIYITGLKIYDGLAGKLSFGKSTGISKKKTSSRLSTIKTEHLKGGVVYHDGLFDDARLAVNIAQTAIEQGATVLNYFKVNYLQISSDGEVSGVVVVDSESDKEYILDANVVINATGVFADDILQMDHVKAKNTIRPSQGIHLVLPRKFMPGKDAIMIPKTADGRILFLIPWHNRVVIGTTDTVVESHSLEPKPLKSEIDFILETANAYLKIPISRADVLSVFAGLRPLAAPKDPSEKTKEISRSHKIIVSKSGLISIIGGKWTTYRRMAQDALNKAIVLKKLPPKKCLTKHLKIHGADSGADNTHHLYVYGTDQKALLDLITNDSELGEKLHPKLEFLKAEVVWAVQNEMARTVEDVLSRRVRILFLDAKKAKEVAPKVAELMAKCLNKNEAWKQFQIAEFNQLANQYIL